MAKKKFIKELTISVNKEINAPKYPKVRVEIKITGVTIPIKDTQKIETKTKAKENLKKCKFTKCSNDRYKLSILSIISNVIIFIYLKYGIFLSKILNTDFLNPIFFSTTVSNFSVTS